MAVLTQNSDTRAALIDAAERLFAEHGIKNVSLRQVNVAAGQKNSGSVHYHFGSKERLLKAILERRMSLLNDERLVFLETVHSQTSIHDVLVAISEPLVRRIEVSEGWRAYALIARELLEYRNRDYRPLWMGHYAAGAQGLFESVRLFADIDDDVEWQLLVEEATLIGLGIIADRAQKLIEGEAQNLQPLEDFLAHLIWLQRQILLEAPRQGSQ